MRIVFIGCVQFSHDALQTLLSLDDAEVVGVVTREESKFNSDFCSLQSLASENQIPCFLAKGNNQTEMLGFLKELQADVIYCFGWSYLLKSEILNLPPKGVVGFHPAALPQNRGRHPLIWALALGLSKTASTFFIMDEGADSGDILSQVEMSIEPDDDAASLYKKMTDTALTQIASFTKALAGNNAKLVKQDHSLANSWRKRGKADGQIDWRMNATSINNLVRALTQPYVGAHCVFQDQDVKVWKGKVATDPVPANIEPGKVLNIEGNAVLVKTGVGAFWILEHEFSTLPQKGEYL
ncbi:MAG: formyl transferase [Deltaproteobacteria bacterium]|nr:formyl transferase [Deltaproteobacteria bacterium]